MKLTSCNPKLAMAVEHVVSNHYPERLGAVIAVNHGTLFQTFWAAVRVFLHARTASKMKIHRHHNKIEEEFDELFPAELRDWIVEEIRLNKLHPVPDTQKRFWSKGEGHDPRGCASYVTQFLDSFSAEDNVYLPHQNILDSLTGNIRVVSGEQ